MSVEPSLEGLREEALAALASASNEAGLEQWRITFFGRQEGRMTALLRSIKDRPVDERATFGANANRLKQELEGALEAKQQDLKDAALKALSTDSAIDVTLPGRPQVLGRLHPVTQTMRDCLKAFGDMGFRVAEGPEVEWDRYNFDGVRIPEDHPARDMWDTIWVNSLIEGKRHMLLRTHTSPNQVRVLERTPAPPVRVVVPGKCYRQEATDATHEWMLTQIEGLAVDEDITMADHNGTVPAPNPVTRITTPSTPNCAHARPGVGRAVSASAGSGRVTRPVNHARRPIKSVLASISATLCHSPKNSK